MGRISAHLLVCLTGQKLAKKSTSPKSKLAVSVVESWYTTTTFFFCTRIHIHICNIAYMYILLIHFTSCICLKSVMDETCKDGDDKEEVNGRAAL